MPVGFFLKDAGLQDDTAALARSGEFFEPTIVDSVKAGFSSGVNAPGSLNDDLNAYNINKEIGQEPTFLQKSSQLLASPWVDDVQKGTPLTEEEYKASPAYRQGLEYIPGLTTTAAQIRAQSFDADKSRAQIYDQSGALGTAGFFLSSIAGSIADAKNLAIGGAVSLATSALSPIISAPAGVAAGATRAVGNAFRTAWRGLSYGRIAALSAEATATTLPSVISGLQNQKVTAREYSVGDALMDLTAASVLQIGLTYGGDVRAAYKNKMSFADKENLQKLAVTQYANGETVHISPMVDASNTRFTPDYMTTELDPPAVARRMENGRYEAVYESTDPELAKFRAEAADPDAALSALRDRSTVDAFAPKAEVTETGPGQFEARLKDETGVAHRVRGKGTTREEAITDLHSILTDPDQTRMSSQTGLTQDVLRAIREAQQAKLAVKNFDPVAAERQVAQDLGLNVGKLDAATKKLKAAEERVAKAEQALRDRTPNAKRVQEQVNAGEALTRAKAQLDSLKSNEFGGLQQGVANRLAALRNRAIEADRTAQRVQGDAFKPTFDRYIANQTRDVIPPKERPDELVQSIDQEAIARDAAKAPVEDVEPDFSSDLTTSRQAIQDEIADPVTDSDTRSDLTQSLKSIDNSEQRSKALRDYLKCRGS